MTSITQTTATFTPSSMASGLVNAVAQFFKTRKARTEMTAMLGFEDHVLADMGLTRDDIRAAVKG
jgi:uncharacterized protein YjiS (DUF1127 family)